ISKGSWGTTSFKADDAGPVRIELAPDHTLRIRVLDGNGTACKDVDLSLEQTFENDLPRSSPIDIPEFVHYLGPATTRAPDGVATIAHAQTYFVPQDRARYHVTFAFPLAERVQVAV